MVFTRMVQQKNRKKKADIIFSLMDFLLRAKKTGIIVNAHFARQHGWSQPGMHLALQNLFNRKIVIFTGQKHEHDKRVTLSESITSHNDWLLAYYGNGVPKKYREYLDVVPVQTTIPEVEVKIETTPQESVVLLGKMRELLEESLKYNEKLEKQIAQKDEETNQIISQKDQEITDLKLQLSSLKNQISGIISTF